MKLLSVKIHNIASIGDAFLDFTAAPLRNADVFLITGPTGAGKSTILDAICIALFAEAPRMHNSGMKTKLEGEKFGAGSIAHFMRTGTGECFAEVTFTANDGADYTARWGVHRSRRRPDGDLQQPVRTLTKADGTPVASKKEAAARIAELIGVDFNQFCRTVMLPQGEFTAFLKSNDTDKAQILEKITGRGIYREISAQIHRRTAEASQKAATLRERSGFVECLSQEQEIQLREKAHTLTARGHEQEKTIRDLEAAIAWQRRNDELLAAQKKAEARDKELRGLYKSDECKNERTMVLHYDLAAPLREYEARRAEARHNLEKVRSQIRAYAPSVERLRAFGRFLDQRTVEAGEKLNDCRRFLADHHTEAENAAVIADVLRRMADAAKEAERLSNKDRDIKEKINRLAEDARAMDAGLKEASDKADALGKKLELARQSLGKYNIAALAEARAKADAKAEALRNLAQLKEAAAKAEESLRKAQENLDKLRADLESANAAENSAREEAAASMAEYNLVAATVENAAANLRALLTQGCQCPVCLQKVEKVPDLDLAALNPLLEAAAGKKDRTQQRRVEASASRQALQKSLAEARKALESAVSQKEKAGSDLADALYQFNSTSGADSVAAEGVEAELSRAREAADVAGSNLDMAAPAQEEFNRLSAERQNATDACKPLEQKAAAIRDRQEALLKEEAETLGALAEIRKVSAALEESLRSVAPRWLPGAAAPAEKETEFKNLTDALHRCNLTVEKENAAYARCSEARHTIADFSKVHDLSAFPVTEEALRPRDWASSDFLKFISDFGALAAVERNCLETIKDFGMKAEEFYSQNPALTPGMFEKMTALGEDYFAALRRKIVDLENDLDTASNLYEEALNKYREFLDAPYPPHISVSTSELEADAARLRSEKSANDIELGATLRSLQENESRKKQLEGIMADFKEAEKEMQRWKRLDDAFGSADGAKFVRIAQSYVLEALLQRANVYLRHLTDRYVLHGLAGSYNIYVEDRYCGSVRRNINTNSGGESFMVSLALALALSEISGTTGCDTLLIDEGFGTLSDQPLQAAVSLLENLNRFTGRRVGIISHIDELRRRIPVQVLVEGGAVKVK